ncbi:acetylglutamate kinase [Planctomycetaceae bacterium]|jgi:acetylglutamate kinase|nr:acetylglutamate kinase [Planctomycetaceae bacterium]
MVSEAIKKADVLIEALNWIQRFRGKYVVIKFGGSALEETEAVKAFLTDVIFMSSVGMKPILIHGGGKAISKAMTDAGIEPRFVQGRRYTDDKAIDIVANVLAGDICNSLVAEINNRQGQAIALNYQTQNCLVARQLDLTDDQGEPVDLGRVGEVYDINRELLKRTCDNGVIPVIPSVAVDRGGRLLNVNADTAAAAVAGILGAEKLMFLSDVPGICRDKDDLNTLIRHVDGAECRKLIAEGVVAAGMVPKVEAALEALAAGVGKVHIVDGRTPHSILLEIYSDTGIGTELVLHDSQ